MQQVPRWSVTEVCKWVDSLGEPLKDYRDVFERQAIDGDVLCDMTEEMLQKDLGIAALGHRHKMMKAIKELLCRNGIPAEPAQPPAAPAKAPAVADIDVAPLFKEFSKLTLANKADKAQLNNKATKTKKAPEKFSTGSSSMAAQPQAAPAAAPAAGGGDEGEQLCKHLSKLKLDRPEPEAAKPKKAELVGGAAAAKAPKRLLAIEVCAGSHPVGRHIQHLQAQQQQSPYTLAAYAAIEVQPPNGAKYRAPEPAALGLTAEHHLSLPARVEDPAARQELLSFVRSELKNSRPDAVVMFGGPPCDTYSNAWPQYRKELKALNEAQASYDSAFRQLQQLQKPAKAAGKPVLNGGLADAQQHLQQAIQNLERAKAPLMKREVDVEDADAVVSNFLSLCQEIQQECKASGQTPYHRVMENLYSSTDKALWNRPFMKETHLMNLPKAPAAGKVAKQEGFSASSTAWLNTVWQNWCTYGSQYPQKPTIIFTTLSRTALCDRRCCNDCKRPQGQNHPVIVVDQKDGEYASAQWPIEFVGAVMRACVGEAPYAGL